MPEESSEIAESVVGDYMLLHPAQDCDEPDEELNKAVIYSSSLLDIERADLASNFEIMLNIVS